MSQSSSPRNDPMSLSHQKGSSTVKSLDVRVIQSLTPIFIATIGGIICLAVLVLKPSESQGFITVASTAIAGAAGLAQPQKERDQDNE